MQHDWVGNLKPPKFKDIGNQRDPVAERKAVLCDELRVLMRRIPAKLKSGGTVQDVRQFKEAVQDAEKIYRNRRSSVPELEGAKKRLELHFSPQELGA